MVADYGPQCKYARWNMAHSIPQFMKNKPEIEDDDHYLEILKAVAQAWQSNNRQFKTGNWIRRPSPELQKQSISVQERGGAEAATCDGTSRSRCGTRMRSWRCRRGWRGGWCSTATAGDSIWTSWPWGTDEFDFLSFRVIGTGNAFWFRVIKEIYGWFQGFFYLIISLRQKWLKWLSNYDTKMNKNWKRPKKNHRNKHKNNPVPNKNTTPLIYHPYLHPNP